MKHTIFCTFAIIAIGFLLFLNFRHGKTDIGNQEVIHTSEAPEPIGPYSQAIRKGNAYFISGQVAINPKSGKLDTTDITTETKQVMNNIKAILVSAHLNMNDISKTTIYLTDLKNFKIVNDIYGTFFGAGPFPARETVQVVALPKGAHIEISAIAVKE